jgi:UDP-N-acetylglucosamine 2-epimerase (non-hydrolysing)
VPDDRIKVTGNTVIDALLQQAARSETPPVDAMGKRQILVTAHRRENFGAPMIGICDAILELVAKHEEISILFPVHPNPNVMQLVHDKLHNHGRIRLCPPLDYAELVLALKQSWLVMTDSGGIQEEAPALGKPVLVLRTETERPEAIQIGAARLVGVDRPKIVAVVESLLADPYLYSAMSQVRSPYGDGQSADRIVEMLKDYLFNEESKNISSSDP